MLEKLKVDQEVDVFLAVAQTRLGRPQLIHSLVGILVLFVYPGKGSVMGGAVSFLVVDIGKDERPPQGQL